MELYPSKFFNFVFMGSIRQNKIEAVIQSELAVFFQRHSAEICLGAMVTVTIVRVTSDLSQQGVSSVFLPARINKLCWKI
jgi:ribosome-binding factor A